jgi:ABC-2 type transport system permease protein
MFLQLLKIELFKIFRRPRTFIAFGTIAAIIILVQFALKANGQDLVKLFLSSQEDSFEIPFSQLLNGYYVCVFILHTVLIHIPLLVALISGDAISGEATAGTLRLLAAKPMGRTQLILAKFSASVIYLALLLIWMAILSLFISMALFGTDTLMVAKETSMHLMEQDDVLWRFFAAFAFATLALTVVSALALMLSVFSENSIGPIVATVCIIIVFTVIQQLEVPVFKDTVTPWLFTTHMLGWKGFFYVVADAEGSTIKGSIENSGAIVKSALILVGYIGLFLGIAIWRFNRKDILS